MSVLCRVQSQSWVNLGIWETQSLCLTCCSTAEMSCLSPLSTLPAYMSCNSLQVSALVLTHYVQSCLVCQVGHVVDGAASPGSGPSSKALLLTVWDSTAGRTG